MKRFLAILLAVTLFVAVMPLSALASDTKTVYVSRNGKGTINLREGPGYDYDKTDHYAYHNSKVSVLKTSGKWSKVKVKSSGHVGWIRTYYIDGTTKKLGTGTHKIKTKTTVYAKASSGSSKRGTVYTDDTVKVYYTERDYASVTVTGSSLKGWIPMSCIGGVTSSEADAPTSSSSTVYRVKTNNGGNLNVRTGPGMGYDVKTSIANGTGFIVLKKSGSWYKVKVLKTGLVGWVSKNLTATPARARVTASKLNVRKSHSESSEKLGSLKYGVKIKVKSAHGNWVYMNYGSLKGWVSLSYLKFCA